MRADGEVHAPLDAGGRRPRPPRSFAAEGVDAVAIAFMNAYANPAHELEAERLLREAGFDGRALAVAPGLGRVPRVRAHVHHRGRRVRAPAASAATSTGSPTGLGGRGFGGDALVTRSGGGAMTFAEAADRPFETIISGPVAGAEGGRRARARPRARRRDRRRRRRHELRHLPDHGRPRRRCSTRARSSACRCRRPGSTCARSAPAAARSPTSTPAACCASARAARAPSPARRATAGAARSRR